ncbi:MAG: hypothetical protein HY033_12820 [Ignavibacteriae bacterium]|nr:hypothetical protein [Ignavibacteriota bacterium]
MKNQPDTMNHSPKTRFSPFKILQPRISTWVIIGFTFWIGFFIGAIILHAMVK